ncbi:MAG: hypothetical protein U0269_03645 [Polyangiales bacterium]
MSYRSDVDALEARKQTLEKQLAELRARLQETAKLSSDADQLVKELEETYAKLNVRKAPERGRRSLPLLQRIYVASPCNVPWESMSGDDRVRHCASCDKDVFDLSALTRDEAEALLIEKKGKLCAQYYRREDGTILTADCEVGVAKKKKARRRAAVIAGAFAAAAAGAVAGAFAMREESVEQGCEAVAPSVKPTQLPTTVTTTPPQRPAHEMLRGDIAVEPSPEQTQRNNYPMVRGRIRSR